jgi:hypothetical protein
MTTEHEEAVFLNADERIHGNTTGVEQVKSEQAKTSVVARQMILLLKLAAVENSDYDMASLCRRVETGDDEAMGLLVQKIVRALFSARK